MRCMMPRSGTYSPSRNGAVSGRWRTREAIHALFFSAKAFASFKLPRGGMVNITSRVSRNKTQRIAPRLPVPLDANQILGIVVHDLDRFDRLRTAIEQRAQHENFRTASSRRKCVTEIVSLSPAGAPAAENIYSRNNGRIFSNPTRRNGNLFLQPYSPPFDASAPQFDQISNAIDLREGSRGGCTRLPLRFFRPI